MARDVDKHCKQYDSEEELIDAAWQGLPEEYIDNLFASMPKRVQEIVVAKGKAIKY